MYVVKYSELVHMAKMHSQARASSPYELVPNILRYTFSNLYILHGRVIVRQRQHQPVKFFIYLRLHGAGHVSL